MIWGAVIKTPSTEQEKQHKQKNDKPHRFTPSGRSASVSIPDDNRWRLIRQARPSLELRSDPPKIAKGAPTTSFFDFSTSTPGLTRREFRETSAYPHASSCGWPLLAPGIGGLRTC